MTEDLTGWWIGFAIAGGVVVVVALVLTAILLFAKGIRDAARDITAHLAGIRANTDALWAVREVNGSLERSVDRLRDATGRPRTRP